MNKFIILLALVGAVLLAVMPVINVFHLIFSLGLENTWGNLFSVFRSIFNWHSYGLIFFFIVLLTRKDQLKLGALVAAAGTTLQLVSLFLGRLWMLFNWSNIYPDSQAIWVIYILPLLILVATVFFFVLLAIKPWGKPSGWLALTLVVLTLWEIAFILYVPSVHFLPFHSLGRLLYTLWFAVYAIKAISPTNKVS